MERSAIANGSGQPRSFSVVSLNGDFDVWQKEQLREALTPLATEDVAVIDVSRVHYVDSTAIGIFIGLRKQMMQNGRLGIVALVGANENLQRIMQICQLDQIFPMYATLTDMEKALATTTRPI